MKIICATNMPFAREAFEQIGDVTILPPRAITADAVRDADILAVRSTTRVDQSLLAGSNVRFVGTATIGTDHMDLNYLNQSNIQWCSAAGCNANSVAEYIVAALLRLATQHNFTLAGKTIAVVGVGNVGRLVVKKAQALGLRVLLNDPPRQALEPNASFQSLEKILPQADIVTMHVPLIKNGSHPTYHMVNAAFLKQLKPGAIFINAARGAVTDTDALLAAMDRGGIAHLVLDTWEREPAFRTDALQHAAYASPHVAGHSFEGKVMGTVMVYRAACRYLGIASNWDYESLMPTTIIPEINLPLDNMTPEQYLNQIVRQLYDIENDDKNMRAIATLNDAERGAAFEELRQNYPMRREFRYTRIVNKTLPSELQNKITGLEFLTAF